MRRPPSARFLLTLAALVLPACGGAGASPATAPGPGGGLSANPGPQILLLFVSGHSFGTVPSYLENGTGPFLESAVAAAGYSVESRYFTDDPGGGTPGGYAELVTQLQQIHADWIVDRSGPTRIVVVAHSHGGVRAHAAIRAQAAVPVRLLVDLDTSSNGWELVHPGEGAAMGGEPKDAYSIPVTVTCPQFPNVDSQAGFGYDVEDVVFENVAEALEVRTGDIVPNPLEFEEYDERWNARLDGSTRDLFCHYSASSHSEPILPTGATLPFVRDWLLARLATD